jgi:hypothetical protein
MIITSMIGSNQTAFAQSDSLNDPVQRINRYVLWVIPSKANNIFGLAIGIIGSEAICNKPYTKYSHGINLQVIGQGLFLPFMIGKFNFDTFYNQKADTNYLRNEIPRAVHNGLIISPFGTLTNKINGLSVSLWMSMNNNVNGLNINLLWNLTGTCNGLSIGLVNFSGETKGVQIGLINRTKKLKGLQFGLWNINEKRSLPLFNWNFKN